MKKYVNLVLLELSRIQKIYIITVALGALAQIANAFRIISGAKGRLQPGFHVADILNDSFTSVIVTAIVAVVLIYIFYTWIREWRGRDHFIVRLLLLPGGRASIYWAKFTAILMILFSFVGIQILLIHCFIYQAHFMLDGTLEVWGENYFRIVSETGGLLLLFLPLSMESAVTTFGYIAAFVLILYTTTISCFSFPKQTLGARVSITGVILNCGFAYLVGLVACLEVLSLTSVERFVLQLVAMGVFFVGNALLVNYIMNKKLSV